MSEAASEDTQHHLTGRTVRTSNREVPGYALEAQISTMGTQELWRARSQSNGEPVTVIFDTERTQAREDLMEWVHAFTHLPPSARMIGVQSGGVTEEDYPYLVCEPVMLVDVDGEEPLIEEDTLEAALAFGIEVCLGVERLHTLGVWHRGIHLQHLVLSPERGPVMAGMIFPGTQSVVCETPEEQRGASPDERADVYGLGVLVWELIGRFDIPVKLQTLLASAVADNPHHRLPTVEALRAGLQEVQQHLGFELTGDGDGRHPITKPVKAISTPVSAKSALDDLTLIKPVAPEEATRRRDREEVWQEASLEAETRLRAATNHTPEPPTVTAPSPTSLTEQAGVHPVDPSVHGVEHGEYGPREALAPSHAASDEEQKNEPRSRTAPQYADSRQNLKRTKTLRNLTVVGLGSVAMALCVWGGITLLWG